MLAKLPTFPLEPEEQQKLGDEVLGSCIKKPLADYLLTSKRATWLVQTDKDKEKISEYSPYIDDIYRSFNRILREKMMFKHVRIRFDFETLRGFPSALFMIDRHHHLLTRKEGADYLINALKDIAKGFDAMYTASPESLKQIKKVNLNLDKIQYLLPEFVELSSTFSGEDGRGRNLRFTLLGIDSLTVYADNRNKCAVLLINSDNIYYSSVNYLYLDNGLIKQYYVKENGLFANKGLPLKTDQPLDFVYSTDNIIGKIPVFLRLQDFWKDHWTANDSLGRLPDHWLRNRHLTYYAGCVKYETVWQHQNKDRTQILLEAFKRLNQIVDKINFNKFTVSELSQFAGLTTKLTDKEVMRVINWYRSNREMLGNNRAAINDWNILYQRYLLSRFGRDPEHVAPSDITLLDSITDYLIMHRFATGRKVQIDYKSLQRFLDEEQEVSERYIEKRDRKKDVKYKKEFTTQKKWNALKENIKGVSDIKLLNTRSKMVTEGIQQHNCVGSRYVDEANAGRSAFLDYKYGGKRHTVQVKASNGKYKIVQMYSTYNAPNAEGAEEKLNKIINGRKFD